jgi:tRNA (pseudouridine54-N1)-methyltransferase
LIFYGQPDPPKHIVFEINEKNKEFFSKKDIAGMIKKMLYKYKKGQKVEVFDSCFIEKKNFVQVLQDLINEGKEIFFLDASGNDIRNIQFKSNSVFVLGDHEGIPKQEKKELEKVAKKISLGKVTYFASQSLTILQNEIDRRRI